jgi:hypothetical protein
MATAQELKVRLSAEIERRKSEIVAISEHITTIPGYMPQQMDPNLVALSRANCAAVVGEANMGRPRHSTGSTDVGDLGFVMPVVHPRAGGVRGTIHGADYVVVDHALAAVNPAKAMAMTVVDLLHDGAREARRIKAEAGPKLSREEYLGLVRGFGSFEEYPGA